MGDNYLEQRQILKVPRTKRTAAAWWEEGPPPPQGLETVGTQCRAQVPHTGTECAHMTDFDRKTVCGLRDNGS